MKFLKIKTGNKFFNTILLYVALSISCTILLVSVIMYFNFENIGRSIISSSARDSLNQVSYSATFMTDTVKSIATQIYFNADTSKLLYSEQLEPEELKVALNRLNSYCTTMPLIHSIYIYNGNTSTFYSNLNDNYVKKSNKFFDQDIVARLGNFNNSLRLQPIPRHLLESYQVFNKDIFSPIYTFVFYDIPIHNKKVRKAVVLNISEEWMRKTIKALDSSYFDSTTFIIDSEGITVSGNNKASMLADNSGKSYVKQVLNSKSKSGYFIDEVDGAKALITYVSSDSLPWKYVRITPYYVILSRIRHMQLTTVTICFSILFLGVFIAYLSSKHVYKPIKSMLEKLDNLAVEKRKNSFQLKQDFIKSVLLGSKSDSKKILNNLIENFEVQFTYEDNFSLILLKIDNYSTFCNKYNYDDRNLMKFAILNVASEICGKYYKNETVDMGEDYVVLVYATSDMKDHYQTINSIILSIQENTKKCLEISLTAAASFETSCAFSKLSETYKSILEASNYRLFYGHESILFVENVVPNHAGNLAPNDAENHVPCRFNEVKYPVQFKEVQYPIHTKQVYYPIQSKEVYYPVQKEKAFIDAMLLGNLDKVKVAYLSLMEVISSMTFPAFNSAVLRLMFSINNVVETMDKNSTIPLRYNFSQFIGEINRLETLDEVNMKFFSMFEQIAQQIEERKNSRHNLIIDKAIEIICQDIKDYNLSLDMLAEKFSISSAHFGRLFKKQIGKSVADYINDVRLENAKHLLEQTNLPISEIVQQTGFSSSNYFYIYFKKTHGITPSEYRQKIM